MCRGKCLLFVLLSLSASSASALSIRVGGETSLMPFDLTYGDVQSPLEIVLQIANDSESMVSVIAWQLELELRPRQGTQGSLLFHDATAPPDSLYGPLSEPQTIPELPPPTGMVLASDADMTDPFEGEAVPQHVARNVLKLTLGATSDAAGAFQLVMTEFDPSNPYEGASWWNAHEPEPEAFDNSSASDFPGFILLGTINVQEGPTAMPGDYDSDGFVTPADFERWKVSFGSLADPPGSGADGNRNGIVDAADYVTWRAFASKGSDSVESEAADSAPEPATLVLASIGMANASVLFYRRAKLVCVK